jgi:LPXTG-site transpeptidase (sortase) family protein
MPSSDVMVQQPVKKVILKTKQVAASTPVRLVIESIGVNAVVQPVGLTSQGDLDISNNTAEVAWYQLGPKPGEAGSAVIAGHYGSRNSVDVVFHKLSTLKVGDTVSVHDDTNSVRTFRVRLIRAYNSDDDAAEVFSSNDGKAHLNLITCAGDWDAATKMYSERTVVFTDEDTTL